ncbi:MAG: endonuclease domain-containing protein [Gammaproteobacteria bacterium]
MHLKVKLVVEVDGSQHLYQQSIKADAERGEFLAEHGLCVLRFDNLQVLLETDAVVSMIHDAILKRWDET